MEHRSQLRLVLCAILAATSLAAGCDGDDDADAGVDAGGAIDAGDGADAGDGNDAGDGADAGTMDGGLPPGPTFDFRDDAPTAYTRVDRAGMPAVSTALITNKNEYNDDSPADDVMTVGDPPLPKWAGEIVGNLQAVHAGVDSDLVALDLAPCDADDAVPPMCVTQQVGGSSGPSVVELVIPDTISIDPSMPAGFPNGRLLADPVIDVTLAVVLLDLSSSSGCMGGPCTATTLAELPLNPPANDRSFLDTFPYLAPPHEPAPPTDAGMPDGGATPDAGAMDAGLADAAAACPDLMPTGATDLVISEVNPGDFIELFNPTGSDIALATSAYQLCQRPAYMALATLAPTVTVPAGGYSVVGWPATFGDTDAGGEIALYWQAGFEAASNLIDFVCWGSGHSPSRESLAVTAGLWSTGCAGAIPTGGSIERVASTDGASAASYSVSATPTRLECSP